MKQLILDRTLELPWLDKALAVSQEIEGKDARAALDEFLLDRVPHKSSRVKVLRLLSHLWLDPHEEIRPMIGWARDAASGVADSRFLHMGALLATFSFFGDVMAIVGKDLRIHSEVETADIRRRLKSEWGDRDVIDVTARAAVRTLRSLEFLDGAPGRSRSAARGVAKPDPVIYPWLGHSLMLSRGVKEIDEGELGSAPELWMVDLRQRSMGTYPFLERFTEGPSRSVLAIRPVTQAARSAQLRFLA